MKLLTPLGLLGLIGVVALIIIYLIRPNYQQKYISSTYIWKLSLKYKKEESSYKQAEEHLDYYLSDSCVGDVRAYSRATQRSAQSAGRLRRSHSDYRLFGKYARRDKRRNTV